MMWKKVLIRQNHLKSQTSQAETKIGCAPIRSSHIHIHQLHCLNTALIFDTMPTSASGLWPHSWTQVQPACKGVAAPELGALLVREHLTSQLTTWVFEVVSTWFTNTWAPSWVTVLFGSPTPEVGAPYLLKESANKSSSITATTCVQSSKGPFHIKFLISTSGRGGTDAKKSDWHIKA